MRSILLLLATVAAYGADVNAASCSRADVQSAINSASAGDTVIIPSGSCTWTTTVNVNKAITVIGAGIGQTVITDSVPKGSSCSFESIAALYVSTGPFRLSGMTIAGNTTTSCTAGHVFVNTNTTGNRIDHLRIDPIRGAGILMITGAGNGVIHDITVVTDASSAVTNGVKLAGGSSNYGDADWARDTSLGSGEGWYIEDSTFTSTRTGDADFANDCLQGGRMVFRYNTFANYALQTHGSDSRPRGCRQLEVYGNTSTNNDWKNTELYYESGVGHIWGNSWAATNNSAVSLVYDNPRSTWGNCNGSSAYDGNQEANGYPCVDQLGRGKSNDLGGVDTPTAQWVGNALEPVYFWNNTRGGSAMTSLSNSFSSHIQANRDYYIQVTSFNGTAGVGSGARSARPATCTTGVAWWATDAGGNWNTIAGGSNDGTLDICTATNTWTNGAYTPYTYPHPLRNESDPVAPTITTSCPLPSGQEGEAYSQTMTATGDTPITWDLSAGALPDGLTLASGGGLTGTPSESGTFNFTLRATNSAGNDTEACSVVIAAADPPAGNSARVSGRVDVTGGARIQ